jgi:hypothetical protein
MTIPAYDEIIELIATSDPERIISFKPSAATLKRVQYLLFKKNAGTLNTEEESELNYYVSLENLIGLAKARAHQILQAA